MRIMSDQNEYDFSKQLRSVNMLKRRLYLRRFLASFVNFETYFENNFANYSTNFWMTVSKSFIIEPTFCEHDRNYKFHNFKIIPC